jgi:hypothetical protein
VLHDLHVSVQALLQQTPSTQNPLAQSPSHPQAVPLVPLILLVPLQVTIALPLSWTDPSALGALEWLPHPATKSPTHPTTTTPTSRAARKLTMSRECKPGSSLGKTRAGLRQLIATSRDVGGAFRLPYGCKRPVRRRGSGSRNQSARR